MADYIKFRLTAARVGVSMALMALIAGISEKVQAAPNRAEAKPASLNFLKLTGINGNARTAFLKLEGKYNKLNTALIKVENALANKYLKITDANAQFLKITDANDKWLKIADANAEFLKIDDANARFLKIDGTAANSALLGNLRPDQFLQGRGNVMTNELAVSAGQSQQLLGDGSVRILIGLTQAGQPSVTLENDTNAPLNFTITGGSTPSGTIPAANVDGPGRATFAPGASQLDIQIFGSGGGGGAGKIWTATISTLGTQTGATFVGQMLIGLL